MKTKSLKLPFGDIKILVNGIPITFEYKDPMYDTYYTENDEEIKASGAFGITVNTKELKPDDIIFVYSSAGDLKTSSGDEGTVNAIAELEKYTYGIGGPDTEFIEWQYGSIPSDIPSGRFGYIHHVLDYELADITEYGLKYKIVNAVDNIANEKERLYICVVWEDNAKPYAYDIVSYLTC